MSAFIVNTKSWTRKGYKSYSTVGRAQAALKKLGLDTEQYEAMSAEDWIAGDTDVTVKNLMSGREVTIKRSERGNPATDPSMEGYFTM